MRRARVPKPAELPKLMERVNGKTDCLTNGSEVKYPVKKREEVMIVENGDGNEDFDVFSPDHLKKSATTIKLR